MDDPPSKVISLHLQGGSPGSDRYKWGMNKPVQMAEKNRGFCSHRAILFSFSMSSCIRYSSIFLVMALDLFSTSMPASRRNFLLLLHLCILQVFPVLEFLLQRRPCRASRSAFASSLATCTPGNLVNLATYNSPTQTFRKMSQPPPKRRQGLPRLGIACFSLLMLFLLLPHWQEGLPA